MLSRSEIEKRVYVQILLNERKWFSQAVDLENSAVLLEDKVREMWLSFEKYRDTKNSKFLINDNYAYTYSMLMAFAIENYLKGVLVRNDKEREQKLKEELLERAALPEVLKTHELYTLATKINAIDASKYESLLRRLSQSAIWRGRYPVPLLSKALYDQQFSDGSVFNISFLQKDDVDQVKELLLHIKEKCGIFLGI